MRWIDANANDGGDMGYTGGTFGHEQSPVKRDWKSTEHNLDVYAVAGWLTESEDERVWQVMQDKARKFLDAMWNITRLNEILESAAFAFLVLTVEDEQRDGKLNARMNVVHEMGNC